MRLLEIIADQGHLDTLTGIAEQYEVDDFWMGAPGEDGRVTVTMLVDAARLHEVFDRVQGVFSGSDNYRLLVLPLDATLPRRDGRNSDEPAPKAFSATREELYHQIERGARLDGNFVALVLLSTIVVAIGLVQDNVAVVVGAMVIAPLLGPNLALAFASSLGDRELLAQSLKTNLAGISLALIVSIGIGMVNGVDLSSAELASRTRVDMFSIALAVSAGAAAVISLTAGAAAALVGVMVAVALLPPTATLGMLLGAAEYSAAARAGLLLAVNIVCVIVAAMGVFQWRGVQPRTWLEKGVAGQSKTVYFTMWSVLLAVLMVTIWRINT